MVPKLSKGERLLALEKANRIRRQQSDITKDLALGRITFRDVLAMAKRGDEAALRMRVKKIISASPLYTPQETKQIMESIGISSTKRVSSLGIRQTKALLEELEGVDFDES